MKAASINTIYTWDFRCRKHLLRTDGRRLGAEVTPDEVRALLGGYATGTLTPEEQQRLFDAALQDQDLFDELAREQALKEAFDDPAVRRELLEVLDRPSWRDRFAAWLRWPIPVAAGASRWPPSPPYSWFAPRPRLPLCRWRSAWR